MHGLKEASRYPDRIWQWWRRWPDANIGIRTGRESGLVVLDVDLRHGGEESLAALEATYEPLPPTLTARSGGGGRHLYFQHPGQRIPNSAQMGKLPGLDVRGDGGYIVAPPSLHRSGQHYIWEDRSKALAALPLWLCALLTHQEDAVPVVPLHSHKVPRADAEQFWLRRALARARPGTRNVTGYWLACHLRDDGVSRGAAEAILRHYAAQVVAGDHPYRVYEALASLRSAYQHPAHERTRPGVSRTELP